MRRRLSRGRFCRRVHRNKDLFLTVFAVLAEHWNAVDPSMVDLIDSFPIASCDTIRIMRSRRYRGEAYRGYIASKRRYFYGLRRHLITTAAGQPVELFLVPGAENDTGALAWYQFDLPCGARIVGDKAFNVYAIAGDLAAIDIAVCPLRKKNSTRAIPAWKTNVRELQRK